MSIKSRLTQLRHAWNAFLDRDFEAERRSYGDAVGYGVRPDRVRLSFSNEKSIISSILTRLSVDAAAVDIRHVRVDDDDRYVDNVKSGLNNCLKVEANIDQAATHFRQDIVMTILDRGTAAIVPVDTTLDPSKSGSFDIQTLRVGEIVGWFPKHVKINLYNEERAMREDITLEKKFVAIVENPFIAVMNEPNSTLQRLIQTLNKLDVINEQAASGKLDLIIQLPYVVKSETRRTQANQRRKDIEFQLKGSKYGIAYTEATEKITQLNRPAENNLLQQVEYLMDMLYAQLGLTPEIMNGTADEKAMLNYENRTIGPIVKAIVESMRRTFLTKTARSQGQSILAFRDPFKYVTLADFAEAADKFSRNRIFTPNDLRAGIGIKPSKDPIADQLANANMPAPSEPTTSPPTTAEGDASQNGRT